MRLTDKGVQSLKAPERGVKVYSDGTLTGFGVRCSQGGSRAYVLTRPGPSRTRVTIGKVGIITLADARVVARRMLAEETLGKHRPPRQTFAEALETFITTRKQRNRPKTAYETERLLQRYFKPLHGMQLEDIRAHHVTDITDDLSEQGLQSTAAHAHTAAHTFLRFCSQRHYIPFNPIADLEKPKAPASRERILSDDELRTVWYAADKIEGHFGAIVKLLILTGQRRSEIGSLRGDWLDLTNNTCSLPATITKNKRSHTFPVGKLALDVLSTLGFGYSKTDDKCPLFPARGKPNSPFNGWSKSKAQLDKLAKIEPWTLHDLRRTYVTTLQRLKVPLEVREALINHVSGQSRSGVAGVYNRHTYWDEMAEAVTHYEQWLQRLLRQA